MDSFKKYRTSTYRGVLITHIERIGTKEILLMSKDLVLLRCSVDDNDKPQDDLLIEAKKIASSIQLR